MNYRTAKEGLVELEQDIIKRPLKTVVLLALCLLALVGTVAISVFVSEKVVAYVNRPVSGPAMHPIALNYSISTTTKDVDGIFHTYFDLYVHVPAGNSIDTFKLWNHFPLEDSSCGISPEPRAISEFRGGLASTTYLYTAECISREKVIDNGTLFRIDNPY